MTADETPNSIGSVSGRSDRNLIADLKDFPLLTAFLRDQFGGEHNVNTTIHPADEMVTAPPHPDQQDLDHALVLYFRAGLLMMRAIEQVSIWRFRNLGRVGSILDFASGFGRLTRLLIRNFAPDQIAISEINRDAVEFQAAEFGVQAFLSAHDPSDFVCNRKFDVVFAASFFTHLPEAAFRGWLAKLWSLLTPGGVLMFTLHNENSFRFRHATAEKELADRGDFLFSESRWSSYLAPQEYGNTLVTDAFLSRVLHECLGPTFFSYHRIPFGLGGFQDLCVVVPGAEMSFDDLELDYGPEGNLEGAAFQPDSSVKFFGWAAARNTRMPVEEIQLSLDARFIARAQPTLRRPEVEQYLGFPTERNTGWECAAMIPAAATFDEVLQARAITPSGLDWLLYIGTLGDALLRPVFFRRKGDSTRRLAAAVTLSPAELAQRVQELEDTITRLNQQVQILESQRRELSERIRAMEASRFWQVRRHWFRLKRMIGLTDGE